MNLIELKQRVDAAYGPNLDLESSIKLLLLKETTNRIFPYHLTTSIDAALGLVEEVCPGLTYSVDATAPECGIDFVLHGRPGETFVGTSYHSLPLAILSAMLSALIAKDKP